MPHGATTSSTSSTTTMTIFFTFDSLGNLRGARQLRIERASRSMVPMSYQRPVVQFAAQRALRDRPAQQRQQRKLSRRAAREELRAVDADARIGVPQALAF